MAWIPGRFNFFSPVLAPRCTLQRLPHLLRLLLMYQDNPFRASASRNFFRQIVHALLMLRFPLIFGLFLWLTADC